MAYQTREQIRQQKENEAMENYLYNWYDEGKLKINYHSAKGYSYQMKELKMKRLVDWDFNTKTGKPKYPVQQYHSSLINMNGLNVQDYNAHRDNEIHRLHSRLTSLQKECRNFVSYDNTELASIDISNSQPYLMCLLFNPLFWQQDSNIPLNFYSLPANIQNRFSPDLINKVKEYVGELDAEEVKYYRWNASNGIMYEYIMERAKSIGLTLTRKKAKEMMLTVFFSKNKFFYQKGAELKRMFNMLHPSIYGLIKLIKSNNHADFACLLQAVESTIILNKCC